MDFNLTDTVAYLTNINSETFVDDFNGVKDQIPGTVTIQFEPSQPDSVVDSLATGRTMYVNVVVDYQIRHIGSTTIVTPVNLYYQQLLPLAT